MLAVLRADSALGTRSKINRAERHQSPFDPWLRAGDQYSFSAWRLSTNCEPCNSLTNHRYKCRSGEWTKADVTSSTSS